MRAPRPTALGVVLVTATALCAAPLAARFLVEPAPVAVLAACFGLSVLPSVLVLAVSAASRRRVPTALAALLVGLQVLLLAPLFSADVPPAGVRLDVLTANLNLGAADASALVAAVEEHEVDVLAVQELTVEAESRLEAAGLSAVLPFKLTDPGGSASGAGLWSTRPLRRVAGLQLTFRTSDALMEVEGEDLLVRSVHPFPPGWSDQERWRADMAALRTGAAGPRARTTLLVGDLNGTVHHREVRRLLDAGGWRDAAEVAGSGLIRTWSPRSTIPALFDLDHVLVPARFGVRRVQALPLVGSDHRAVLAELSLPPTSLGR